MGVGEQALAGDHGPAGLQRRGGQEGIKPRAFGLGGLEQGGVELMPGVPRRVFGGGGVAMAAWPVRRLLVPDFVVLVSLGLWYLGPGVVTLLAGRLTRAKPERGCQRDAGYVVSPA